MMINEHDARYPIGTYQPQEYSQKFREDWLNDLLFLPNDIEIAIQNLDSYQLDTPYRDGGWTVKQLVHHVADSHINAYLRFKLALTEDHPTIKTYDEKKWALLDDVSTVPINVSVTLLHALHQRWHATIKSLDEQQLSRTVFHPEHKKELSLWFMLGMYAWHGRHHVAHINALKEKNNW